MSKTQISFAGAAVTVAAALVVIMGLLAVGKPSRARQRRLDGLRVDDLSQLSSAVETFWARRASLPSTLDTLVAMHQLDAVPRDPQTNTPYTYLVSGERSYRLCATFAQPSDSDQVGTRYETFNHMNHSWRHGAGESCFDLTPPQKDSKSP